jgi:hypothetical protein
VTRLERHEPDLHVIAEWSDPDSDHGPDRLVVEAPGISAATMRRVSRKLVHMTAEFREELTVGGFRTMVRQYAENRLAELPEDGDGFHRGLLEIHDRIDKDGRVEAVPTLAAAMRVPEETMRACLRVARQRVNG